VGLKSEAGSVVRGAGSQIRGGERRSPGIPPPNLPTGYCRSLVVGRGTALEMDRLDRELRRAVARIWPTQSKKLLPLLMPHTEGVCCFFKINPRCIFDKAKNVRHIL